jgi:23S rRNA U2552 (ribose-2'-O)-methylase RlmE/FtsJ
MKKIGNPYELIYTTYNKKKKNDSISLYSPISRSYFKLWEIFYNFDVFEQFNKNEKYIYAHLAEGPGGFMEATYNYRSKILSTQNLGDIFYGITLKPTNDYVPDWNKIKKVFNNSPNINIEYGNLYNIDDVNNYLKIFKKKKAHFATADGGFDYSTDFNRQEVNSCKIIYSETVIALNVLRKGGSFVCKVFDLFSYSMVQIMYLLYSVFEKVIIYKPETSRPANSEKYIVCINFHDNISQENKNKLIENIKVWDDITNEENTAMFENIKIDADFLHKLSEHNLKYIEYQMHYLKNTIKLSETKMEKNEYNKLINNQVSCAINWCKKYGVKINENSIYYKKNV